jgi:hypothetical protein
MKRNETDFGPDGKKKPPQKLNEFIQALLTNPNLEDAAKAAGVSRTTGWRWRQSPNVIARLREARQQAWGHALDMLQAAGPAAVSTLRHLLSSAEAESVRASSAKALLELSMRGAEIINLEERLNKLEEIAKSRWKEATDAGENQAPARPAGRSNGRA